MNNSVNYAGLYDLVAAVPETVSSGEDGATCRNPDETGEKKTGVNGSPVEPRSPAPPVAQLIIDDWEEPEQR